MALALHLLQHLVSFVLSSLQATVTAGSQRCRCSFFSESSELAQVFLASHMPTKNVTCYPLWRKADHMTTLERYTLANKSNDPLCVPSRSSVPSSPQDLLPSPPGFLNPPLLNTSLPQPLHSSTHPFLNPSLCNYPVDGVIKAYCCTSLPQPLPSAILLSSTPHHINTGFHQPSSPQHLPSPRNPPLPQPIRSSTPPCIITLRTG